MAVSVTGASGSSAHGGALTITGSGFGTKSTAAPIIWDNCDHTVDDTSQITAAGWTGAWPSAGTQAYRGQYRTAPYRTGMNAPHSRVGKYFAGAHGDNAGGDQGYNVMLWKNRTLGTFPNYTYACWYQRSDDAWVFGLNDADDNYKCYAYGDGTSPYDANYFYTEYNPRPTSTSSSVGWKLSAGMGLDPADFWGTGGLNPHAGTWSKVEHFFTISNVANGGRLIIKENNVTYYDQTMRGDNVAGTGRNDGIGGFSRNSGNGNNYRYFADIYLDYSLQHVMLGNASTLAACTVLEVCPPTAWSDTSVTVTVNRGALADSGSIYAYVYDAAGTANSTGYDVSGADGGGGGASPTHRIVMGARARWV